LTLDPDADDVRRILAGQSAAFEGIVRRWQKPLLNLAWRSCRRRELAEDMTQEALVKIFRSLGRWKGDARFSTWAFAIALNHYRSRLRRSPRQILGLEAAHALADPRSEAGGESAAAEALRHAVQGLPPRYREAIVVHYLDDQDVRESAAVLGIAEGTLKARLARARALLARSLGVLPHGDPTQEEPQHG
jgi:RNA polymerase sigma-70 factor (ECF subfamily)